MQLQSPHLVWVWGKILDCGNGQTASGEDAEDPGSLPTEHGTLVDGYVEGLSSCHNIDYMASQKGKQQKLRLV